MFEPIIFETLRLIGRRLDVRDLASMLAIYSDVAGMRWVGDGRPLTEAECRNWIEVTEANYRVRGYGMFALVEKSSGGVIGFCGLVHPGNQIEPEIKYALHQQHWGKGYATEAACALLAWGAEAMQLRQIIATAAPAHEVSQHVLRKAGMQRGIPRQNEDGSFTETFNWTAPTPMDQA